MTDNVDSSTRDSESRDFALSDTTPSHDVFTKDAPVLSLPSLDQYLGSIPAPSFTPVHNPTPPPSNDSGGQNTPQMFIPLEQLAKRRTLSDMFYNNQVAPAWKNRNSLFSFVCDLLSIVLIDKCY